MASRVPEVCTFNSICKFSLRSRLCPSSGIIVDTLLFNQQHGKYFSSVCRIILIPARLDSVFQIEVEGSQTIMM
jgi:hypothetical protein